MNDGALTDSRQVPAVASSRRLIARRWWAQILYHWPIAVVLATYAGSAMIVPTLAPVSTTDDWGYARSVEILVRDGRLVIFPVVAATAVFHVIWGTLFTLVFDLSLGVLRLSTVALVGVGSLALYGLCRQLGVNRSGSALGAAIYLFNPLGYLLAFTFMTDAPFTALLICASFFYARGLDPHRDGTRATIVGSVIAACAILTRQQGVLIPIGVATYLLTSGQLRLQWRSLRRLLAVGGIPAMTLAAYYLWLRTVNGVPAVQESFFNEAVNAGWSGAWRLVRHLTFFETIYLGLFLVPLAVAMVPALGRIVRSIPARGWLLICAWEAVVIGGVTFFAVAGRWMPYIPQFLGPGGPGAADVRSARPVLLEPEFRIWATWVCAAASLLLVVGFAAGLRTPPSPERSIAGLLAAIGLWQVIGILPPSFHYIHWAGSLDRYLLPLLPIAIALALWAVRDTRPWLPLGWIVVAAMMVVSTAMARDYLVFLREVWTVAREANEAGVPNDRLDAGSGWDGYHLYERSLTDPIAPRTQNGPWWTGFYAPHTDSTYIVAGRAPRGYNTVFRRKYSSWLETESTFVYLLRRTSAPWPPDKASP